MNPNATQEDFSKLHGAYLKICTLIIDKLETDQLDVSKCSGVMKEIRQFLNDNHISLSPAETQTSGNYTVKSTLPFPKDAASEVA